MTATQALEQITQAANFEVEYFPDTGRSCYQGGREYTLGYNLETDTYTLYTSLETAAEGIAWAAGEIERMEGLAYA